jgi:hypothetical protein
VPERYHENDKPPVVNLIDDPIVAGAYAPLAVAAG